MQRLVDFMMCSPSSLLLLFNFKKVSFSVVFAAQAAGIDAPQLL